MKKTLLALALLSTVATAAPAPYPITINSRNQTAPNVVVYQGNEMSFRASFTDGSTASDITGATPFMNWATNSLASGMSTSSWQVVGATTGLVDFTFSPQALNFTPGRYMYEVGLINDDVPSVYRQGVFQINGSPQGSGAAAVVFVDDVNWSLIGNYYNTSTDGPYLFVSGFTYTTNATGQLLLTAAITETQDLQAVTDIGATTTREGTWGGLTTTGTVTVGIGSSLVDITGGGIRLGKVSTITATGESIAIEGAASDGSLTILGTADGKSFSHGSGGIASNGSFSAVGGKALGTDTVAMGVDATATSSDSFVFAPYKSGAYSDHGSGTFSVNPLGGTAGFYIGSSSLATLLAALDLQAVTENGGTTTEQVTIDAANAHTNTYGGLLSILGARVQSGTGSTAGGDDSHAEGRTTTASGDYSHSEGSDTVASGARTHAAGQNASATHDNSFVWADGTSTGSTATKQFTVHADNGIRLLGAAGVEIEATVTAAAFVGVTADAVTYTNDVSGLAAEDVQAAIDELAVTSWTDDGDGSISRASDVDVTGSAQLGDAATDTHGINTAPVAGQMLATLFTHDTLNESARGVHHTLNFAADHSSGTAEDFGFDVEIGLTGDMTGSGGPDRKNVTGFRASIDDSHVYNGISARNELIGMEALFTDASTKTNLGGLTRYGSKVLLLNSLGTLGDTKNYGYSVLSEGSADESCGFYANVSGATESYAFYALNGDSYFKDTEVDGSITQTELSADPADPAEGTSVQWQSDGTGSGDDGDIMMKITAGGVTKTATLVDFSAL